MTTDIATARTTDTGIEIPASGIDGPVWLRTEFYGEDLCVTLRRVLRSGAGFYIGRLCWNQEGGYTEPFSRESGYYRHESDAQNDLDRNAYERRDCLEASAWAGLP